VGGASRPTTSIQVAGSNAQIAAIPRRRGERVESTP
jgi:hypothetical protein